VEAVYLDTHVVVWLRQKELEKFTATALEAIEKSSRLLISPMVELELKYLYEIGRLTDTPHNIIGDLDAMIGLSIDDTSFHDVVKKSLFIEWTRDPFDRLIVAQAMAKNYPLITKDEKITVNFNMAIWE
jgi:PIN domain nuclease of toxin-antitoxin system